MESWTITTIYKHYLPVTFTLIHLLFICDSTSFRTVRLCVLQILTTPASHTKKRKLNLSYDYGLVGSENVSTRVHVPTFRKDLLLPSLYGAFA